MDESGGAHIDEGSLQPGTIIKDRYKVQRLLGTGAYGSVYLVQDLHLGTTRVAMKLFSATVANDEVAAGRIHREMRACFRVKSPHFARFFDTIRTDHLLGYTMEWIDGCSLEEQIAKDKTFTPLAVVETLAQICMGLSQIHRYKILHRDLKPANIIVSKFNLIKIADFGLATLSERPGDSPLSISASRSGGDIRESASNVICGTPLYISPEAIRGEALSQRSDLYAVGAIGFEMLFGGHPFPIQNAFALLEKKAVETPVIPDGSTVDPRLGAIVVRLLDPNPARRYRNASEVLAALRPLWLEYINPIREKSAWETRCERWQTSGWKVVRVLGHAMERVAPWVNPANLGPFREFAGLSRMKSKHEISTAGACNQPAVTWVEGLIGLVLILAVAALPSIRESYSSSSEAAPHRETHSETARIAPNITRNKGWTIYSPRGSRNRVLTEIKPPK